MSIPRERTTPRSSPHRGPATQMPTSALATPSRVIRQPGRLPDLKTLHGERRDEAKGVDLFQIADLNIGLLVILGITSIGVYGIALSGWSSNNKWSLLGGMRSAAQIVSYEIPAGLSILTIVFLAGTLSMQGIIKAQGWAPWDW